MKKAAVALIIILALVATGGCLYYFDVLNNVGFFNSLYSNFTKFGLSLQSKLSFLKEFDGKTVFILFYMLMAVIFLIIFLIISEIIVKAKKKKAKKEKKIDKQAEQLPFPVAFINQPESQFTFPENVPASISYRASNSAMTEKEKDIEFQWKNFVGGKKIIRRIVYGLIALVAIFVILARFFWDMRDANGLSGVKFIDTILNVKFISSIMKGFDTFFHGMFGSFMADAANADKNLLIKNFYNGQNFYAINLLEILSIVIIALIVGLIYGYITKGLCKIFAPIPAKRRAKAARSDYEKDVAKNITPEYQPKHVKTTYIFNYFMNPTGVTTIAPQENVASVAPIVGKEEVGTYEPGHYENVSETTKAELIMGGSNFTGGNISSIAVLDPLTEQYSEEEDLKRIDYYEDISEGVKDVEVVEEVIDEEKPYEEYEDLSGTSDDVKVLAIADIDEEVKDEADETLEIESARLGSIFEIKDEIEEESDKEVKEVIDFDEDGFAYKSVGVESSEEEELIPEPQDIDLSYDSSTLIEDHSSIATIHEPDFELLGKVSLIKPVISIRGQKQEKPVEEVKEEIKEEIVEEVVEEVKEEPIESVAEPEAYIAPVTVIREDSAYLSDEQLALLAKYTPTVRPVEELPDESQFVDDGAIKNAEIEDEVIEEIEEDNATPAPMPEGIKPLHEIKNRETPKIVPLAVKKEEKVEEEVVAPTPVPLKGPLHEINAASRKKDIKPVEINKDYRFALKRFQTTTYKGNLTPEEAFTLGVTKVAPVVNPVASSVARDNEIPSWMKRVKERNAKQQGITESNLKQAEEISSIWEVNSKKDVVEKVNEVSLRRRKKVVAPVEPIVEEEEDKDEVKIYRPRTPLAVKKHEEEKVEEVKEPSKPIVQPIAPLHRPTKDKKDIQPIKPITPIKPKK